MSKSFSFAYPPTEIFHCHSIDILPLLQIKKQIITIDAIGGSSTRTSTSQTVQKIMESASALTGQRDAMNTTQGSFSNIQKESVEISNAIQEITACVEELVASSNESGNLVDKVAELTRKADGCTDDILAEISSYHTLVSVLKEQIAQFGDLAGALKAEAGRTLNG